MANERTKLSKLDRYYLSNQLRILEALYPDDAEDHAIRREALESGYELLYDIDMDYIYDGDSVMSVDDCREVWDTMDLFVAIGRALQNVQDDEFGDCGFTKFRGYDGNNETKFMAFAAYTVERLKRFTHVPMEEPGYFNSHMPVRATYRRMLDEWQKLPMRQRFEMSADQLRAVFDAAVHPEQRQR